MTSPFLLLGQDDLHRRWIHYGRFAHVAEPPLCIFALWTGRVTLDHPGRPLAQLLHLSAYLVVAHLVIDVTPDAV